MNRGEKRRIDPAGLNKILLIRLRRIGDVVMTTPAIEGLKRSLRHAFLSYVIEEPYRRLVEGNPNLGRVITVPARQSIADLLRFVRELRRDAYDAVIDFHGGPRASRIAWLSRAKVRVGYKLKYKSWMYDIRIPRSRQGTRIHSVENHLNMVRALGVAVEEPLPSLFLPEARPEEKKRIDKFWSDNNLAGARILVLHIGAGNEFRDWGADNLAKLARRLASLSGVKIILVGDDQDRKRAEIVAGQRPDSILSLVGEINLIELREVISRAALFVGPDSGPMHIAASTRTPIVALFGPTLPANFAPWSARAMIIEKDLACRPCRQRECVTHDFRCLRIITVEEVFAACVSGFGDVPAAGKVPGEGASPY